jgi:hypothetical protein
MNEQWLATRLLNQARWHVPIERRFCSRHAGTPAQDRCDRCGLPFCDACLSHLQRWRVCTNCLATLRREWTLHTLPQRLKRTRAEIVAAGMLLLGFISVAALIQHLLGPAASDAGLAQTALSRFGAPPAQATVPPGQPVLQFAGLYARGDGRREQVRTGVQGRNFQPGEAVRVTVTWQGSRTGSPVVTEAVGPLSAVAGAAGDFSVDADFGDALPDLPNSALVARATGSRGSHATLYRLLGHE